MLFGSKAFYFEQRRVYFPDSVLSGGKINALPATTATCKNVGEIKNGPHKPQTRHVISKMAGFKFATDFSKGRDVEQKQKENKKKVKH